MTQHTSRRRRGVILTQQALNKLQAAKAEAELNEKQGHRFTLEDLSERTGLAVDTLMKVFAGEVGVDKQSLKACFTAFNLPFERNDFYFPGGAIETTPLAGAFPLATAKEVDSNAMSETFHYLKRPLTESICYEHLMQSGALVRVKAPSLMGKTVLMNEVLQQLAVLGYRTVKLSFELADRQTHFASLNKFLRWFCMNIARELGIPHQLTDYWDEESMGAKVSCTTYFEDYLLTQDTNPLVLCLDDVDLLFPYPEIYEDFFGLLRSWHEKAKSRDLWQRLRLAIIHATDVYIRLNINQSPFNVGLPVELSEFSPEQVKSFARQYGLAMSSEQIALVMERIGGHPYLLEQAFAHWKTHPDIDLTQLLSEAATDAGIYRNHLQEHWVNLQNHPELTAAFKKVVMAEEPLQLEPVCAYQLYSMGLVKLSGNYVEPRCNLYRQYFSEHLDTTY